MAVKPEKKRKYYLKCSNNFAADYTLPYFPRVNEQVKRAIQTFKHALTKAKENGKDLTMVLLDYKTQPSSSLSRGVTYGVTITILLTISS